MKLQRIGAVPIPPSSLFVCLDYTIIYSSLSFITTQCHLDIILEMTKYSGSCSSNKPTITRGSVCSKCQRTFNNRSSLKKHHDYGIRPCVPRPSSLAQVAVPGTLILSVSASHYTVSDPPPPILYSATKCLFSHPL
jgi:hypothetical protein